MGNLEAQNWEAWRPRGGYPQNCPKKKILSCSAPQRFPTVQPGLGARLSAQSHGAAAQVPSCGSLLL